MAKKRANGEGSIRKKPNGRWEGRYTQGIDPNTGRAIQKSVSARTQAECKEKLAKAIRDNRGIPVNHNEDYTVAEWCRLWFETYSKPVIRHNTAKTYENIIENHIVPAIGGVKLKRLTAIQIQKMYNDSKTSGRVQRFEKKTDTALSGSTVRRIHMVLSSALKQAVKERIIPYNPCDNCRIPPKGDDHHPAGETGGISQRGGEVRRPTHVLPGAVQRPAAWGIAGAPVGRPECKGPHPLGEQAGHSDRRGAGGDGAKN